jgi:hypothetical protein
VWVSGNTKPHKDDLKQAGFQWAPKKCSGILDRKSARAAAATKVGHWKKSALNMAAIKLKASNAGYREYSRKNGHFLKRPLT